MNELKPCPFCDGEAKVIIWPGYFKAGLSSNGWLVKCVNGCCNQTPYMSDHDAVEAWNTRAQTDQNAYGQGRIAGRVEMRAEILEALKKLVGSEVWNNI